MATTIRDVISRLRQPVLSLDELEELLVAPLVSLGVSVCHSTGIHRPDASPNTRQLAALQSLILAHVYPTWGDQTSVAQHYFIPPKSDLIGNRDTKNGARSLVLGALTALTTPPLSPFAISLLEKFVKEYPLDLLWDLCRGDGVENRTNWDGVLRAWMSIPGKVANALLGSKSHEDEAVPAPLQFGEFTTQTCLATTTIMWNTAQSYSDVEVQHLTHLISKLVSTGHFSQSPTSFFVLTLPQIQSQVASCTVIDQIKPYTDIWPQVIQNLPGPHLQTFASSLLAHLGTVQYQSILPYHQSVHGSSSHFSSQKTNTPLLHPSSLLSLFFGPSTQVRSEVWHVLMESGASRSPELVRSIVGWATGMVHLTGSTDCSGITPTEGSNRMDNVGISMALEHVLARWSDPQHVSRALLSEHRYLTSLLVLTLGALSSLPGTQPPTLSNKLKTSFAGDANSFPDFSPPPSPPGSPPPLSPNIAPPHPLINSTSTSPSFLRAVGDYLSQRDEAVRRCGMLVAEIVAGGRLNFGGWVNEDDGEEKGGMNEWQRWAAELRAEARDPLGAIQKEIDNLASGQPPNNTELPSTSQISQPDETPHSTDVLAEVDQTPQPDSDDDSLVGYTSPSPTSSRAPSPTPSELADPTLRRRPIPRPVYLAELGALLVEAPKNVVEVQPGEGFGGFGGGGRKGRRGMGITGGRAGGDSEDEKGRVDMALKVGAELIRRKRGYGSELEENAVNLAYLFMGLQDNFDLDRFEDLRQEVLVALVACCPTKAAPTIIEQFFHHQYSTAQRFTMLNALALGARELAGLPVPPPRINSDEKHSRFDFPSKVLPGRAHLEYLTDNDLPPPLSTQLPQKRRPIEAMRSQVSALVDDMSGRAIARSKEETEERVPQVVRERALKVGPRTGHGIVPLDSISTSATVSHTALRYLSSQTPVVSFSQVAAEYFVAPLINRFWAHLRGSLEQEAYLSGNMMATGVRMGVGTGLILSPLVLAHLLGTLSVLLHASRHAPAFLHVLAPDAAELALAVGTRPVSLNRDSKLGEEGGLGTEAGVLAAALELALAVLDGAIELDGGRVFAIERTEILTGVGQWASAVFEALDKGDRVPGRGGTEEEKVVRIAAGVVLTVERAIGRWRRSVVMV